MGACVRGAAKSTLRAGADTVISKLRGRSLSELRGRLAQQARALAERRGILPSIVIPAGAALDPRTPWGEPDAHAIRAALSIAERCDIVERADRIVNGTFDVLGLSGVSYGSPVNWRRDPLAGREAPSGHWSRVPYLDHERVGDHKVTWELNRHQWLITLGQAWLLTGDTRYPTAAASLLRDWLTSNPPKQGINWCSALELAFRVQSWIHALRLMHDAPQLDAALRTELVASAALQIDHIVRNLSTWFSPNTHLTGEALAILSAGCAWPDLPHAARWRTLGWKILCDELPKQLRPDGVYFEQSAWYQAYTLDFYTLGLMWASFAGLVIPIGTTDRIRDAARALRAVTRPDGTIAMLGDDDGGRTLPLTHAPFGDMTASLWRAAALLQDETLVPPVDTSRSTLLWLEGVSVFDAMRSKDARLGRRASSALRDGGWVTMTEQAPTADRDHWLVLDAGPHGALSNAHSHADALAIDLSVHGVPIFVDPGTCAYVGVQRRRFRSTAVHNTVTVDGADSSEQGSAFNWRTATDTRLDGFGVCTGAQFVIASHDGYARLADPVRHTRLVLRLHQRYWLMLDTIDGASTHQFAVTFQTAPGARIDQRSRDAFVVRQRDVAVHLALDPKLTGWVAERSVSPAYALEVPAVAIVATADVASSTTICTAFGADDESGALDIACDAPRLWRIAHAHGADLVARPNGTAMTVGPVRFDGAVVALLGAEEPHTIVAAGAGTLHLAGTEIPLGANAIRVASRGAHGTWTMES